MFEHLPFSLNVTPALLCVRLEPSQKAVTPLPTAAIIL